MYIRVTSTPRSPRKSVKVVESIREGLKVKQVMSTLEARGCQYVVAAKLRGMSDEMKSAMLTGKNYNATLLGDELAWTS